MKELCGRIFHFYRDGFTAMRVGRTLWLIILLKLFILFFIIKPFFFPDILQTRFGTNEERASFVFRQLSDAAVPAHAAPQPARPDEVRQKAEALLETPLR